MTIAVSPKDDAILFNAVGTGGRDLYLLDVTDLEVTRIAETPDYDTAPSFSPNGPTGVPKFSIWEIAVDGGTVSMLAARGLFDAPLGWKPATTS